MTDLVITLGHNSSAIAISNGKILAGYEEERFTGTKSESQYPINAIQRLQQLYGNTFSSLSIGHWFTGGKLQESKYCNLEHIRSLCNAENIYAVNSSFTHHDSHAESADVFASHYGFPDKSHIIIADGFGTYGECISIYYRRSSGNYILQRRIFGFWNSLGMLYQYTTAYLNMKMHNHEYKILGYEAHIHEHATDAQIGILDELVRLESLKWLKKFTEDQLETDAIASNDALIKTRRHVSDLLDNVIRQVDCYESLEAKRVIISYFVQNLVEEVMIGLLDNIQDANNLILSGGLFYNVKLNSRLADKYKAVCVMPLAGDQGAGLGVYNTVHGDLKWPGHLFWGKRHLDGDKLFNYKNIEYLGLHVPLSDIIEIIGEHLDTYDMVNIVRGAMEFGPRSLCNTATLAKPHMDAVDIINKMNGRTTIMPMAPVMTRDQAESALVDIHKVYGSLEYMVITRDVKPEWAKLMDGAIHRYQDRSTCRPQITEDPLIFSLVDHFGPLINTSFNVHGSPICYDTKSIIHSHVEQNKISTIKTLIIP